MAIYNQTKHHHPYIYPFKHYGQMAKGLGCQDLVGPLFCEVSTLQFCGRVMVGRWRRAGVGSVGRLFGGFRRGGGVAFGG